MLIGSPGTALAAYGPPTPTPPVAIPGGYYCIVTSQTAGPAGKATGPLSFQRLVVRLGVSKGTFPVQVQITVTEPYGQNGNCQGAPDIGNGGLHGFLAFAGVGILVQVGGLAYPGEFLKPLILRLTSKLITSSTVIVVWHVNRFVKAPHAVVHRGSATVAAVANSDFAVLNPAGKPPSPATTSALYLAAGSSLPGLGVRAPARPHAPGARGA
jgi:hypothetical protein